MSERFDIGRPGRPGVEGNYEEQNLEGTNRTIIAHKASICRGAAFKKRPRSCPIHRRSPHHMRAFPQNWRDDRGIMERICPHGIGHPDPDDPGLKRDGGVHGCDGCCSRTRNTTPV